MCYCSFKPVMVKNKKNEIIFYQSSFGSALERADKPFDKFDNYWDYTKNTIENNRNYLLENLPKTKLKLQCLKSQGGFFMVNIGNIS